MKNLGEAVLRVQERLTGISKGSYNSAQKYEYTSVEQMIATVRGHMREERLWLVPTAQRFEFEAGAKTAPDSKGREHNVGVVRTEWVLLHVDSGESMPLAIDMPAVEGAGRPMDKAASASLSQAITYLMRAVFMLPRGTGEVDIDGRDDSDYGGGKQAAKAPPFAAVLARHGLTVAQWDAWARVNKRTAAAALAGEQAQAAAAWLAGEGSAVVSGWCQAQGVGL